MWLVLVAAGTGYLARCWQNSRKFKTGPGFLKCNVAPHASQGSPSTRRGRSNTAGRRGLRKRSRSARGLGRKLLHGRKEGKLATTQARDSDENLGSPVKFFEDLLCGKDFEKDHIELFRSLTSVCSQDHLRETSSRMEKPDGKEQDHFLFSDCVLPIEKGSSNGGITKKQLEGVASFSSNWLSSAKPTKNPSPLSASTGQLAHCWLDILGFKTVGEERRQESLPLKLKKSTEQAFRFFVKVARAFTHRSCSKFLNKNASWKPGFVLNTRDAHVLKHLSHGKLYSDTFSEVKKMEERCTAFFVDSQHLKALLDSESAKPLNSFATSKSDGLRSQENRLQGFNAYFVALGVAMGVLLVATGRSCDLEDLHKLLRKNNALMEELRKQIDSRFEMDPSNLPEVEKVPSGLTVANETCPRKAHRHPDISSSHNAGEKGFLELCNAHGFDDLEAELEAELRLLELNGCNADPAGCEWKGTQFNQKCWQPDGDEKGYIEKPEGDDDDDDASYVDIDIHDSIVTQDAGQVYESDFVVPPLELERRLWQVLEQRHEERICELKNDLRVTQEKVRAKEVEVEWWKERVGWCMEASLEGKSEHEHPASLNP